MKSRGFTLLETLITVTIITIMASVAIPQYTKVVERGRFRTAQGLLQAIYAGEQVYETANGTYVNPATCATPWRCIYMDNPNSPTMPVTYTVSGLSATTFTATATHTPNGKTKTIDQNHTEGGTWNP